MLQHKRENWLIVDWVSYVFGFNLNGCSGEVKVVESRENLEISVIIDAKEIALGILTRYADHKTPLTVTFSALNATPNIRFKIDNVDIHRQVEVPLLTNTRFYIVCDRNTVKAVLIVPIEGAVVV